MGYVSDHSPFAPASARRPSSSGHRSGTVASGRAELTREHHGGIGREARPAGLRLDGLSGLAIGDPSDEGVWQPKHKPRPLVLESFSGNDYALESMLTLRKTFPWQRLESPVIKAVKIAQVP